MLCRQTSSLALPITSVLGLSLLAEPRRTPRWFGDVANHALPVNASVTG